MRNRRAPLGATSTVFLAVLLAAAAAAAQDDWATRDGSTPQQWEVREYRVLHRSTTEIFRLIQPYCEGEVGLSESLGTITVSGTPARLDRIAEVIAQYDTPLAQIWVEVILVMATGSGKETPVYPDELAEVVDKLAPLFKFDEYRIVGRANAMGLEGAELALSSEPVDETDAAFQVRGVLGMAGEYIKLQDLTILVEKPTMKRIATSVNVRDGELVILGASRGNALEGSLITLVTAKVLE
jgi:hypothetical protein